ncbi:hypothetical protein [Glutamicibacter sp. ZJUTW]|uniref:hypothetical protein n=1 Tax=Glutamicibacter sp. ZJUTW TaxID=1155384 RepID=UPI0011F22028|nr:hypothetical protein [Glutamicibacter sp. ZJUTW]QEP06156.1 hypothetical protein F0M17_02230 [Glutamicibacter sp. ZJUTW]
MAEELDVRCVKANWLGRLMGEPRFTITIDMNDVTAVSGTGNTVKGAWETARRSARLFMDTTLQDECPFDERGEPIGDETNE